MDEPQGVTEPTSAKGSYYSRKFTERICVRKGCGKVFQAHVYAVKFQRYCSEPCRYRDYWDSGRCRTHREQVKRGEVQIRQRDRRDHPVLPVARSIPAVIQPAHYSVKDRPALVNTHVPGSVVKELFGGHHTVTRGNHHASGHSESTEWSWLG